MARLTPSSQHCCTLQPAQVVVVAASRPSHAHALPRVAIAVDAPSSTIECPPESRSRSLSELPADQPTAAEPVGCAGAPPPRLAARATARSNSGFCSCGSASHACWRLLLAAAVAGHGQLRGGKAARLRGAALRRRRQQLPGRCAAADRPCSSVARQASALLFRTPACGAMDAIAPSTALQ